MSTVIIRLLITMAIAVALTYLLSLLTLIAAGLSGRRRARRADRCRCGLMNMAGHDGTEVVAWTHAGVRHERQRCQPLRETV